MRNNNFDFLRFYFASVVFLAHFIILTGLPFFQPLLKHLDTYISITAFFVISGFLITVSYQKSDSFKKYLIKRANRLLPAYIVLIIIVTIGFSTISNLDTYSYFSNKETIRYFLSNLTFQNYLQPSLPGVFSENVKTNAVNGSLWTLKVEVLFYLLIPLFIRFIHSYRAKNKNIIIPIIIIYISSVIYKYSCDYFAEYYKSNILNLLSHQLPGFMSYFVCGIGLYFYLDEFKKNKLILFVLAVIVFTMERYLRLEILTPLALSIIIFSIAFSLKWLNNFAKFGDISYGIYIYHFPIIQLGIYFKLYDNSHPIIALGATTLIVVTISFLSWHLIEKKFLRQKTGKF